MSDSYDVVVIGCGGAGAATTWSLASRGARVLAVDRFDPHHTRGSSHGSERIFRLASGDPVYVALAGESLPLWRGLSARASDRGEREILRTVGGVDLGDRAQLEEVARGCDAEHVAYEWLDAGAAAREFPGLHPASPVLVQRDAGTVDAERALDAFAAEATNAGAHVHRSEAVLGIREHAHGVEVTTDVGRYAAETVVVTTGAWAGPTLAGLVDIPPIEVTQEQVGFFRPSPRISFPTFISRRGVSYYGLPTPTGLLKIGEHYTGPRVDPDARSGELEPQTWARLLAWVRANVPGVDPEPVAMSTCLYASAPGEDFVVDRAGRIVVGIGLGGHGFKYLPILGERLADLASGQRWPDNPFALEGRRTRDPSSPHK